MMTSFYAWYIQDHIIIYLFIQTLQEHNKENLIPHHTFEFFPSEMWKKVKQTKPNPNININIQYSIQTMKPL